MSDLTPLSMPTSSDIEDDDAKIQRIIARDYAYPRAMEIMIDTGASASFINDASFFDSP
jgi:hypothetical protein